MMEEINDSIIIKSAETDEELYGCLKKMRERFVSITNMGLNLMDAKNNGILAHQFQLSE